MTSFSDIGCQQPTGLSTPAQVATQNFDGLLPSAQSALAEGTALLANLSSKFAKPGIDTSVQTTAQLSSYLLGDKPDIDLNDLNLTGLDEPGSVSLNDLTERDIDANFPQFEACVISNLATQLCGILDGSIGTGLPTATENAFEERGHARIVNERLAFQNRVTDEYSRYGWAIKPGLQDARIRTLNNTTAGLHGGFSRDWDIQLDQETLNTYRLAMGESVTYTGQWVTAYSAWVDALTNRENVQLLFNQQILQKLRAQLAIFQAQTQKETARIDALARKYGIEAAFFQGDVVQADAISRHDAAAYGLETGRHEASAGRKIEAARANNDEIRADITQYVENLRAAIDFFRQTVASIYQAMSVRATLNSSVNDTEGKGCSTSYSFTESVTQSN